MSTTTLEVPALELVQQEKPAQPLARVQQQTGMVVTPDDLLRMAMESGDKDLDRLERLMGMQERYRASQEAERLRQAELAFHDDFAQFTQLGIVIPKTKLVRQKSRSGGPGPTFWQSEFDHVCRLLKPALGAKGFGVHHEPVVKRNGKVVEWIDVTCTITHRLGHSRSITLGGPPDDSGSKNPGQEIQSTITFWERHTLLALTSTAQEGKDNDGRGARGYRDEGGSADEQEPGTEQGQAQSTTDRLNAATTAQELAKVMSSLKPDEKRQYVDHFNERMAQLKKGAEQ